MSIRPLSERRRRRVAIAIALAVTSAGAQVAGIARADGDPLDAYRDTFRRGMERYRAGAVAEAVPYWENVYRELGPAKGYRVAYNLARAYDALGDSSRAAEKYEAFLAEHAARAGAHAAEEAVVVAEADASRARLAELVATKARLRIALPAPGNSALVARIDGVDVRVGDVIYVAPGAHTVSLGSTHRDLETRVVEAHAGELLDIEATPAAPSVPPEAPAAPAPRAEASTPALVAVAAPHRDRPFAPVVLVVAGGVTLLGGAVTTFAYASALSKHTTYGDASTSAAARDAVRSSYPSARTFAYGSLGVTIALAAATGALATYYLLGGDAHAAVIPTASIAPSGASFGAMGRF